MNQMAKPKEGVVRIHNKDYKTVALRVNEFQEFYGDWSIETELITNADLVVMKATVKDETGRIRGTGFAEEDRSKGKINSTSALENCETSAIGRALACIGLAGTEYASANEVENAITQQEINNMYKGFKNHMESVINNYGSIECIQNGIQSGDYSDAAEAWFELDKETKEALWVAPSKGGVFTTKEREVMKSTEFKQAHFGDKQ